MQQSAGKGGMTSFYNDQKTLESSCHGVCCYPLLHNMGCGFGRRCQQGGTETVFRISPRSVDTHSFMSWRRVGKRYGGRVRTISAEGLQVSVVPSSNNSVTVKI